MVGSRLLKGLHVVGYVTTVIVLVEMAGGGFLAWIWWNRSEPIRSRLLEASRTHDRPLGGADIVEADAAKAYQHVRPSAGSSDDVLGFVYMPSFSPWFAASIRLPRGAVVAEGEMISVRRDDETRQLTFSRLQSFTVPRAAYLTAALRMDSLTDGWSGNGRGGCFDGVPVAFERARAGRVTSGVGNASCDPHYAAVNNVMGPLLSQFGPKLEENAPPAVAPAPRPGPVRSGA